MDSILKLVQSCFNCCSCKFKCKSKCCSEEEGCEYDINYVKNNQEIDSLLECFCCACERHLRNTVIPETPTITQKNDDIK